jgi:hypothetical protein
MRVAPQLLCLTLLCIATSASPAQIVGANADSIPNDSWVGIYFRSFDRGARAAGLAPLRETTLRAGEREVRLWTGTGLAAKKELYRWTERNGRVLGELIYYWSVTPVFPIEKPGETTHDLLLHMYGSSCERVVTTSEMASCRPRFRREPPWARVLRQAESLGLWMIPDPSTLPSDRLIGIDGWSMVVELRDGPRYRTYYYHNPWSHTAWPSAAQANNVARARYAIDSLLVPPDADRVYRGVTSGRYRSAFRSCDDGAEWDFYTDLRSLLDHAPPSVRAAAPALADTTGRDTTLYEVDVRGVLSPEWLARRWESKYPRVLQVLELRAVRPASPKGCARTPTR